MPSPNPTTRREYKGAAAGTTLQNSMSSSDTTFVLVSANNWPTGGVGKFVVTINRGLADEEKILCDTQSTRNVSCLLANRGFDGTTAQSHAAGATVECTISAFDADEWNAHTAATTGVHGFTGDLSALGTAWTAYTCNWTASTTNPTLGTGGAITARYKQISKTVIVNIAIACGATGFNAGTGSYTFSLPVAVLGSGPFAVGSFMVFNGSVNCGGSVAGYNGSSGVFGFTGATQFGSGNITTPVSGSDIGITVIYETA